ncbi:hypothetical protein BDM02DRAFT_3184868 [Thelephora ganbajun]|uniref:Uncharacterized protein n=1 Tax=Thelephora ganbajun TaxID=370292 RepID=A0ACB6ZNQ5_THEGA|nr:hypothetical protein BDM02DRAFT_3184868 [Thelephora ganbajun]
MDRSPSKRMLTETTLDLRNIVDSSTRNDCVSDELRALVRNRAARVRVMEGYFIDRTASLVAQDAHTDANGGAATAAAQIFQSSRDISHRVLRNCTPSSFSSPNKRTRYDYEAEDALEEEDEGEGMEIDPGEANPQTLAEDTPQRPIKPLRRTLFADASIASKSSISQNHTLYADHDNSRSENPFFE